MTLDTRPLAEITQEALHILYQQLGIVDTVRFLTQFTTGYGNYTEERRALVEKQTMDEVLAELKEFRNKRTE
jgi:hypothetical protein